MEDKDEVVQERTPAQVLMETMAKMEDGESIVLIHRKANKDLSYVWSGMNGFEAIGALECVHQWIVQSWLEEKDNDGDGEGDNE